LNFITQSLLGNWNFTKAEKTIYGNSCIVSKMNKAGIWNIIQKNNLINKENKKNIIGLCQITLI